MAELRESVEIANHEHLQDLRERAAQAEREDRAEEDRKERMRTLNRDLGFQE